MRSFIVGAIAVLLALPLQAQRVQEQMLVSPDWLQRRLGMVTVLHIGDAASYEARHIPGAVLIELSSLLVQRDGTPNELPPVDALEQIFRSAGAGATGRIVVYSVDPLHAARAWFTLDYLGQGGRASLLDGGLANWIAAGYAISTETAHPSPGSFEARPLPQTVVLLSKLREVVRLRAHRRAVGRAVLRRRSGPRRGATGPHSGRGECPVRIESRRKRSVAIRGRPARDLSRRRRHPKSGQHRLLPHRDAGLDDLLRPAVPGLRRHALRRLIRGMEQRRRTDLVVDGTDRTRIRQRHARRDGVAGLSLIHTPSPRD